MALIFMARGGVYLAGGISQKILSALMKPEFRAAFEDKAPHSALMRTIPSFAVVHPMAALSGLAAFARDLRLVRAPDGDIELLQPFWQFDDPFGERYTQRLCPPLLIYADLVLTGDKRNLEAAAMLERLLPGEE
jgi:hypothetical protein